MPCYALSIRRPCICTDKACQHSIPTNLRLSWSPAASRHGRGLGHGITASRYRSGSLSLSLSLDVPYCCPHRCRFIGYAGNTQQPFLRGRLWVCARAKQHTTWRWCQGGCPCQTPHGAELRCAERAERADHLLYGWVVANRRRVVGR